MYKLAVKRTLVGDKVWLQLECNLETLRGHWIEFTYTAPADRAVYRPLMRATLSAGKGSDEPLYIDQVMRAPIRGAASWIGYLPKTTQMLLIQPGRFSDDSGFQLTTLKRIGLFSLLKALAKRDLGLSLLVAGTWLLGRREEARQMIRETLLAPQNRNEPFPVPGVLPEQTKTIRSARPPRSRFVLFVDAPQGRLDEGWFSFEREQIALGHAVHCLALDLRLLGSEAFSSRLVADIGHFLRLTNSRPGWTGSATNAVPDEVVWIVFLAEDEQLHPRFCASVEDVIQNQTDVKAIYGDLWRLRPSRSKIEKPTFGNRSVVFEAPPSGGVPVYVGLGQEADLLLNPDWSPYAFNNRREGFPTLLVRAELALLALEQPLSGHPRRRLEQMLIDEPRTALAHVPRPLTARVITPAAPSIILPEPTPLSVLPEEAPISIIIPTRDRLDVLKPCLESVFEKTVATRFNVVLVDNGTTDPEVLTYYHALTQAYPVRLIDRPGAFNFSWLCNEGAKVASGQILVFLNNDTMVKSPYWLIRLASLAALPRIGAVGPRLLYADGTIQHEGVVVGMGGLAGHLYRKLRPDEPAPGAMLFPGFGVQREVSAVTGACLAVARSKFDHVGGFNAEDLPVDLNDIDFCLRLGECGFTNLIVPNIELFHYESQSRGVTGKPFSVYRRERDFFRKRWSHVIQHDPDFHPALSLYASAPQLD